MKTVDELLSNEDQHGWKEDQYGYYMHFGNVELRLEPLLFGGYYVALYDTSTGFPSLVGEKFPVGIAERQGVEDGVKHERERIVTALLSDSTLLIAAKEGQGITDIGWTELMDEYERDARKIDAQNVIMAALDHIGLTAEQEATDDHE